VRISGISISFMLESKLYDAPLSDKMTYVISVSDNSFISGEYYEQERSALFFTVKQANNIYRDQLLTFILDVPFYTEM
jgi:hypothetical protein